MSQGQYYRHTGTGDFIKSSSLRGGGLALCRLFFCIHCPLRPWVWSRQTAQHQFHYFTQKAQIVQAPSRYLHYSSHPQADLMRHTSLHKAANRLKHKNIADNRQSQLVSITKWKTVNDHLHFKSSPRESQPGKSLVKSKWPSTIPVSSCTMSVWCQSRI